MSSLFPMHISCLTIFKIVVYGSFSFQLQIHILDTMQQDIVLLLLTMTEVDTPSHLNMVI